MVEKIAPAVVHIELFLRCVTPPSPELVPSLLDSGGWGWGSGNRSGLGSSGPGLGAQAAPALGGNVPSLRLTSSPRESRLRHRARRWVVVAAAGDRDRLSWHCRPADGWLLWHLGLSPNRRSPSKDKDMNSVTFPKLKCFFAVFLNLWAPVWTGWAVAQVRPSGPEPYLVILGSGGARPPKGTVSKAFAGTLGLAWHQSSFPERGSLASAILSTPRPGELRQAQSPGPWTSELTPHCPFHGPQTPRRVIKEITTGRLNGVSRALQVV